MDASLKPLFAAELLKNPNNAFAAALVVCRNNSMLALDMARDWTFDDEVLAIKQALLQEHGEDAFLPTKYDLVHIAMDRARVTVQDSDFEKLVRLIAEMQGIIKKPGVTVNNNTAIVNKVMCVPVLTDNSGNAIDQATWEQKLIEQQETLISQ